MPDAGICRFVADVLSCFDAGLPASLLTSDAKPFDPLTIFHHEAHARLTRLEMFLLSRGIAPAHLARESGYSRQHLLRVRLAQKEPTRPCIAAIVMACRFLSREQVLASDLFDLGEGSTSAGPRTHG
jgi:hypothetical protein